MKNVLMILSTFLILSTVSACSNNSSATQTSANALSKEDEQISSQSMELNTKSDDSAKNSDSSDAYAPPLVSYDEIKSGVYNEQKVYINCKASNVNYNDNGDLAFDAYVLNETDYVYDGVWSFSAKYIKDRVSYTDVKDGDIFQIGFYVHDNFVFNTDYIFSSKKIQLTSNINADAAFSSEEIEPKPSASFVSYDDIKTGEYDGKDVYIRGAVSNMEKSDYGSVSFDFWIENGDFYIHDGNWLFFEDDISRFPSLSSVQDGDVLEIQLHVYDDSSIGSTGVLSVANTNSPINLEDLYSEYKSSCESFSCEEILRNPEQYSGKYMTFTGNVLQIISQDDSRVELLLSLGAQSNNIVYVSYDLHDGESRILKDDNITVYGIFYKLYDYVNLLGTTNEVPEIWAEFIDLN